MATHPHPEPFQGIADPTRRRILELLAAASRPVREIAERFPVSRPAISKHLRLLREAGLVTESRRGRERIYELVPGALAGVVGWLGELTAGFAADGRPPRPGRRPQAGPARPPAPAKPRPRPSATRREPQGGPVRRPAATGEAAAADWRVW